MSPTYRRVPRFIRDYENLTAQERKKFVNAVTQMVSDLRAGEPLRPGLRVKRVQGTSHVWEMTWAPDGRATWQYGEETVPGETHVIWRRVGTHDILKNP